MKKINQVLFSFLTLFIFVFLFASSASAQTLEINAGGGSNGAYVADQDYSGGQSYTSSLSVDTTNVINPAPESVYQSVRFGNTTYEIPTLTPNAFYTVRLHFNELYWGTSNSSNQGGTGSR